MGSDAICLETRVPSVSAVAYNRENKENGDGGYTWEQLTQLKRDWPTIYELLTLHPDLPLFKMATGAKALGIDPKTFRRHWKAQGFGVPLEENRQWAQAWKADLWKFMLRTGRVQDDGRAD